MTGLGELVRDDALWIEAEEWLAREIELDEEDERLRPLNAAAWSAWCTLPLWFRERQTLRLLEAFFEAAG